MMKCFNNKTSLTLTQSGLNELDLCRNVMEIHMENVMQGFMGQLTLKLLMPFYMVNIWFRSNTYRKQNIQ